jgi:hypothetical protein
MCSGRRQPLLGSSAAAAAAVVALELFCLTERYLLGL